MLVMALCAVCLVTARALAQQFGMAAVLGFTLAVLSVLAHLTGAALGNRGRRLSGKLAGKFELADTDEEPAVRQPMTALESDFAPATQLSRQQPLVCKPIFWSVGIGAIAAAMLASVVLTLYMWDHLLIRNVVFGALSAAVLGGLFGFLISSFLQIVSHALAEAKRDI